MAARLEAAREGGVQPRAGRVGHALARASGAAFGVVGGVGGAIDEAARAQLPAWRQRPLRLRFHAAGAGVAHVAQHLLADFAGV